MKNIKITMVQSNIVWEDSDANLANLDALLDQADNATDIIVLPEMFNTGFSTQPEPICEPIGGKTVNWMQAQAVNRQVGLVGSLIINEEGKYFNRLVWAAPDGSLRHYDKKYLFSPAGENKTFSSGNAHLTIAHGGWHIRTFICYDLRFPEWARNYRKAYDIAIFVANWPAGRAHHWKSLLVARAIENQAYVVGVNRVGADANQIDYAGDSMVVDPFGNIICQAGSQECLCKAELSHEDLTSYRSVFPVWQDAVLDQ